MRAEVTRDTTTRTISLNVIGVPDIDVTRTYHRKPRIFRPDRVVIRVVNAEIHSVSASGGLVLKSGAASTEVREGWQWHPDTDFGIDSNISTAPAWVHTLVNGALVGITFWNDEKAQSL